MSVEYGMVFDMTCGRVASTEPDRAQPTKLFWTRGWSARNDRRIDHENDHQNLNTRVTVTVAYSFTHVLACPHSVHALKSNGHYTSPHATCDP